MTLTDAKTGTESVTVRLEPRREPVLGRVDSSSGSCLVGLKVTRPREVLPLRVVVVVGVKVEFYAKKSHNHKKL